MKLLLDKPNQSTQSRVSEKSSPGVALVEAVVILPAVLVCIFALIFAALWMGESAALESAVRRGAIYASRLVSDPQYDTVTASAQGGGLVPDFTTDSYQFNQMASVKPYRYLFFNKSDYEEKVCAYVDNIVKNSFIGVSGVTIGDAEYEQENKILFQNITIRVKATYQLPGVFKTFGLDQLLDYEARVKMTINDPDEFIRNADLVVDIVSDVMEALGWDKKLENLGNSISEKFSKIFAFKDKLFS